MMPSNFVNRMFANRMFANQVPLWSLMGLWLLCAMCASAAAQGPSLLSPGGDSQKTELGIRQKLVQRKMVELESKFTVVAEKIRQKNPARADLLIRTYQQSKEQSLTRKMDEVGDLLNSQQYVEAEERLDEIVDILESLIRLLTNEKEKTVSPQKEMQTLEKFKKQIQQQLQEQRQQTKATDTAANKPESLDKVGAQIKALDGLIKKQTELIEETAKSNQAAAKLTELDKIADKQFEVRKGTSELNKNIAGEKNSLNKDGSFKALPKSVPGKEQLPSAQKAEGKSTEDTESSGQPSDGQKGEPSQGTPKSAKENKDAKTDKSNADGMQSGDTQGGEEKADDQKADDQKADDQKADDQKADGEAPIGAPSDGDSPKANSPDGKPPEGRPEKGSSSDSKSSDSKSSDGESSDGQPSDDESSQEEAQSGPPQPPQPGEESLKKAAEHQQRAEEKLGSGKPADAQRQQEEALKDMKQALAELEKEKRRIDSLPPEALEQLAKEQRRNRDKALDLIKDMEKAPKRTPSDGEENAGNSPPQQPGQSQMSEAEQAQGKAAESMEQGDSQNAQQEQKQAEKKMQEALEEIEDRLSQLREETNEEKLARLEARFQEMFDRQQTASVMTTEIEDKRANLGRLRHRDQLLVLRTATEELEIRELAQQAYDVLLEDGTSIVFPEIVQDLRSDLETAATMLQNDKTDQYTQLVQKEIETTILDLLDALKEAQKKGESGGGGGGGGGEGGKQPLLKQSAELKILRMRQRRLNRRTLKLEALQNQPEMKDTVEAEIREAAQLQKKILEMTDNIMKKSQQ